MIALPAWNFDVQAPAFSLDDRPPTAIICPIQSPRWVSLGASRLQLGEWLVTWNETNQPPASTPTPAGPTLGQAQSTIGLELLKDGVDPEGHWRQTFRLTIKPGGTLSDASLVIYGDPDHVAEMFNAARQSNPDLQSPGLIQIGTQLEVTVDPTRFYVVKESSYDEASGTLTTTFYNGVHLTAYSKREVGVQRSVEFPSDRPAQQFQFPLEEEGTNPGQATIAVPAGHRLVDYIYDSADSFHNVVNKVYGVATVRAMQDFIKQSKWDPNHWPPSPQQRLRLVVAPASSFADEPIQIATIPLSDPEAARKLADLNAQRARLGIFPVQLESLGTVYHVAVSDPAVTAKEVAKLLYNDPDRYTYVAEQAGIALDKPSDGSPPPDPLLLGRSFQIYVQYDDEEFLLSPPAPNPHTGRLEKHLVNGTVIDSYQTQEPFKTGMVQVVYYPSGYKRILYQPGALTLDVLDFFHFVLHPETKDMPADRRQVLVREFQAQTLWDWGLSTPRQPGDDPEWVRMTDSKRSGPLLEELIRPPKPLGWPQLASYYLLRFPFLIPFVVVVAAVAITLVVAGMARFAKVEQPRQRWRT